MAALFSSLPYDFFTKTIGIGQIGKDMLSKYPMAVDNKDIVRSLRVRTYFLIVSPSIMPTYGVNAGVRNTSKRHGASVTSD